ncbi:hypothetical protein FQN50_009123 [Emmonsiellopsis sp. PD_5]|nr:hypothetical protein FQN50_009123 [Emmonsiellopsis sp. PD_5]
MTPRFFSSSKFTDFVIRTTDEEFKVHKWSSVVNPRTFLKVTENSIGLIDDDPRTIEAMIHFMYGSDYDSSGNSRGRISPMLFNARVYGVAEKYGVSRLKQEAKAKFEDAVRTCWDMDDFTPVIMEAPEEGTFPIDLGGLCGVFSRCSSTPRAKAPFDEI